MHVHQYGRILFYLEAGALKEAVRWADEVFAQRETIPPNFITPFFVEVARTKIARGKLDESRGILVELLATLPSDAVWSYMIIDIALVYGELHLALGQPENLFSGLDEQIQPYRKACFDRLLADEHWLRGRAALALGQHDAAGDSPLKAKEATEAQEERAILWKILATVSEVEKAGGNEDLANSLCDKARAMVDNFAAHAGEMRDVFLNQPTVARVLTGS